MDSENFVSYMEMFGKATEDNLHPYKVVAIINECNLKHGTDINIQDFAMYLIAFRDDPDKVPEMNEDAEAEKYLTLPQPTRSQIVCQAKACVSNVSTEQVATIFSRLVRLTLISGKNLTKDNKSVVAKGADLDRIMEENNFIKLRFGLKCKRINSDYEDLTYKTLSGDDHTFKRTAFANYVEPEGKHRHSQASAVSFNNEPFYTRIHQTRARFKCRATTADDASDSIADSLIVETATFLPSGRLLPLQKLWGPKTHPGVLGGPLQVGCSRDQNVYIQCRIVQCA